VLCLKTNSVCGKNIVTASTVTVSVCEKYYITNFLFLFGIKNI